MKNYQQYIDARGEILPLNTETTTAVATSNKSGKIISVGNTIRVCGIFTTKCSSVLSDITSKTKI